MPLTSNSYLIRSRSKETPSDYSVEEGCHKLDLIATIL
jgi:hypothetical protein